MSCKYTYQGRRYNTLGELVKAENLNLRVQEVLSKMENQLVDKTTERISLETPKQITERIIEELKETGLADEVVINNTEELLKFLQDNYGISEQIAKQVAYKGFNSEKTFWETRNKDYGELMSGDYLGEMAVAVHFSGIHDSTQNHKTAKVSEIKFDDKGFPAIDMKGRTPNTDADLQRIISPALYEDLLEGKRNGTIKGLKLVNALENVAGESSSPTQYVIFDKGIVESVKDYASFDIFSLPIEFQNDVTLTPYGFAITKDGKSAVYLNSDFLNPNTAIHEFGHLYLNNLKQTNQGLYEAGLKLIESNSIEAQEYIDFVTETQPNLEKGTEKWQNEVLAQVIGDNGARLIEQNKKGGIKEWLDNFFKAIREMLGLSDFTIQQVSEMTLREFGEAVNADLLKNKKQNGEKETGESVFERLSQREQFETTRVNKESGRDALHSGAVYGADQTGNAKKSTQEEAINSVDFQIVGEKGATALDRAEEATRRMDNLEVAKQMKERGVDKVDIKLFTQWELGADGKWKFEIADNILTENIKNFVDSALKGKISSTVSFSLSHVAPDIVKIYPQANEARILIQKEPGYTGNGTGYYAVNKNKEIGNIGIKISDNTSIEKIESILLHEIQHLVQRIEGFAAGGGLETSTSLSAKAIEEVTQVEKAIYKAKRAEGVSLLDALEMDTELPSTLKAAALRIAGSGEGVLNKFLNETPYSQYKKLAGEVEARNVQRRAKFTPEERAVTLLSETQDISAEDQIVLFDLIKNQAMMEDYAALNESHDQVIAETVNEELPLNQVVEYESPEKVANFSEELVQSTLNYKRIPKIYVNLEGKLSSSNLETFTTIKNTMYLEVNLPSIRADIHFLEDIHEGVWENNISLVGRELSKMEQRLIEDNIDLIGIKDLAHDRNAVLSLTAALKEMVENPTNSNINNFAILKDELLGEDHTTNYFTEELSEVYKDKVIVRYDGNLKPGELFERAGLIKIADNLYHKVEIESKEEAYELLYNKILQGEVVVPNIFFSADPYLAVNKEATMAALENYVKSREVGFETERQEEVSLAQVIFDHLLIEKTLIKRVPSNAEYLTGEFVSDFYNYILQEKYANSEVYNKVLKNFRVTDNDLSWHGIDRPIIDGIKFESEIRDYAALKREPGMLKHLIDQEYQGSGINVDLQALNNPKSVKAEITEYDRVTYGKDKSVLITEFTPELYVIAEGKLHRKVTDSGNKSAFQEINLQEEGTYFEINTNFDTDFKAIQKITNDRATSSEVAALVNKSVEEIVNEKLQNPKFVTNEGLTSAINSGIEIEPINKKVLNEIDKCS